MAKIFLVGLIWGHWEGYGLWEQKKCHFRSKIPEFMLHNGGNLISQKKLTKFVKLQILYLNLILCVGLIFRTTLKCFTILESYKCRL